MATPAQQIQSKLAAQGLRLEHGYELVIRTRKKSKPTKAKTKWQPESKKRIAKAATVAKPGPKKKADPKKKAAPKPKPATKKKAAPAKKKAAAKAKHNAARRKQRASTPKAGLIMGKSARDGKMIVIAETRRGELWS